MRAGSEPSQILVLIGTGIQLLAAGVVILHVSWAIYNLLGRKGVDSARLILAEGVLAALGFSLAATLLKVIGLQSWIDIRTFATVFLLRTLLKQVFVKERARITARMA